MLFYFTIWSTVAGTVGLVMAFARTGPDEARSKLAEWAEFLRLNRLAGFLNRYALDSRVLRYGKWAMVGLLFGGGMIFQGWLNAPPTRQAPSSTPQNDAATKLPAPSHSKQAIAELLSESGALLDIVIKAGMPAAEEWRTSIAAQNPEQICLGRDATDLRNQITLLVDKLSAAQKETTAILDQNKIDQAELAPLLGWSFPSAPPSEFADAASSLNQYRGALQQFGDHPSCEILINRANLPMTFSTLIRAFDAFSIWLVKSRDRLTSYREALRKEARDLP
jgi:hypothetical protein